MLSAGLLEGLSVNQTKGSLSSEEAKTGTHGRTGTSEVRLSAENTQPRLSRRMAEIPIDRSENVTLHLDERALLIGTVTELLQVLNGRNALLGVLELGGEPESDATDELVVLLVYDAA